MTESLSPSDAWALAQSKEASIVDVRGPSKFALGHPPGAISLPFSQKGLETRLEVLLHSGTPVILLTDDRDQAKSALSQLGASAYPVLGVIEGSLEAWYERGLPVQTLEECSVHEITGASDNGNAVVLDVRESIEWEMGHVPDAILISLGALRERLNDVPKGPQVIVICEAGVRSSSAASILQAAGFDDVVNVPEGTAGYRNAGLLLHFLEEGTA